MAIKDLLNPADNENSDKSSDTLYIILLEMVHGKNNPVVTESKLKEFDVIILKEGVKPVSISVPALKANIIRNRYVLFIKYPGTGSERFKARWILLEHKDEFRHKIANDLSMTIRMIYRATVSISVILFKSKLCLRDVEQAFMQDIPL